MELGACRYINIFLKIWQDTSNEEDQRTKDRKFNMHYKMTSKGIYKIVSEVHSLWKCVQYTLNKKIIEWMRFLGHGAAQEITST